MKIVTLAFAFLIMTFIVPIRAHQQVVVVPLGSDAKIKNVITVSDKGGDFKSTEAALNSISDASASNPYLIVLGPGVYTITQSISMKEYVSISGSGTTITKVSGALSSDSSLTNSIFKIASNSTISNMTISNQGGASYSTGIYSSAALNAVVENVNVEISGGSVAHGIEDNGGELTIRNSKITVQSSYTGADSTGIYSSGATTTVSNSQIFAYGAGNDLSYGVQAESSSSVSLYNLYMYINSGYDTFGILNRGATIVVEGSRIITDNATNINQPAFNQSSGTLYIRSTTLEGENALTVYSGTVNVSNSSLLGSSSAIYLTGGAVIAANSTLSGTSDSIYITSGSCTATNSLISGTPQKTGGTLTCLGSNDGSALLGTTCNP